MKLKPCVHCFATVNDLTCINCGNSVEANYLNRIDQFQFRCPACNSNIPDEQVVGLNGAKPEYIETNICIRCNNPYCNNHASPVDLTTSCIACLPLESVEEIIQPLKDIDGVTHRGRYLIPAGHAYHTLPAAISNMSYEELETFIKNTAQLIHDTEKMQDYRRASLSTAKLDKQDRDVSISRALKGVKVKTTGVNIIGTPSKTGKSPAGTKPTLFADPGDLLKFIQFIKNIKSQKVNPAPTGGGAIAAPNGTQPKAEATPKDPREAEIERLLEPEK